MTKNYLQLEFGSGLFFDYSKEEKQGYVAHTSTKGNVSYRKYYKDGVTGVLESASIYQGKFGNQISLNIKNEEDVYYVPIDIADQKGNVDTYAESMIKLLPELSKGDVITIKGYNFTPEGDKYSKIGMSVVRGGIKIKPSLTNAYYKDGILVDGNIPATVWKKDVLGKNKPTAVSLETKNDYLLEVLKKETDRLKWGGNAPQTVAPTKLPTKTADQAFAPVEDEDDTLPF